MNMPPLKDQLLETLIASNRKGADELIDRILAEGMTLEHVIMDVVSPALSDLGKLWENKSVSLAQNFVAVRTLEDFMQRYQPSADTGQPIPSQGPVVIGNIEDDFHGLGRRIVTTFLRAAGWQIHDLGNDVTAEQFVDKALEEQATVVAASAMTQTSAMNIRKLRDLIDARGLRDRLKLAVGGAVFNWRPDLVAEVGGDGTTQNAAGANALMQRLQAEVKGASQA